MQALQTVLMIVQVLVAIVLIGIILLQHGRGADAGAAFGSGASATVFGARGSSTFLSKTTTVLAALFLANSLMLGYLAAQVSQAPRSVMEEHVANHGAAPTGGEATELQGKAAQETSDSDVPALPEQ